MKNHRNPTYTFGILAAVLAVGGSSMAFKLFGLGENYKYILIGAATILVLHTIFFTLEMLFGRLQGYSDAFAVIVGLLSIIVATICILVTAPTTIGHWFSELPSGPRAALVGTSLALALAFFAFWVRLRYRLLYGISELLAGISVSINRFLYDFPKTEDIEVGFFLAIITASIFLMVRGFDNMHQGITKEPVDPVWIYINSRIASATAEFEESINIAAPRETVFEILSDVSAWSTWNPDVAESKLNEAFSDEAQGYLKPTGCDAPGHIEISALDPNSAFTLTYTFEANRTTFEHQLFGADNETLVRVWVAASGPAAFLKPLAIINGRRGLVTSLVALKRISESRYAENAMSI